MENQIKIIVFLDTNEIQIIEEGNMPSNYQYQNAVEMYQEIEILMSSNPNCKVYWINEDHDILVDERDDNIYQTIKINDQWWMAENLSFRTDTGCWAYDNDESNTEKYGYLYNWEIANKIAPKDWHLPSKSEFETLLDKFGNSKKAYNALIKDGSSGLAVIFAGWCDFNGVFDGIGINTGFWSATEHNNIYVWICDLNVFSENAHVYDVLKSIGLSIRLVKDIK